MVRAIRQFFAGFLLPLRGSLLLLRHRHLLIIAAAPLLLNVLLYLAAFFLVVHYYEAWFSLLWTQPDAWYWSAGYVVLRLAAFVLLLALLFFSFVLVGTAVAAPFLDVLSARVEQLLHQETTAPASHLSWLRESMRAVGHAVLLLCLWLGVLPLSFLPGFGPALWLVASWLLLAYNFAAFAFARRPWSFREQWRRLLRAWAATLGFGAAVFLLLLVPLLGLVLLPTAAVGGTLLVRMFDPPPAR